VSVAWGAFPTACYRHYDYDPLYLNQYREAAIDEDRYRTYLETFVYGIADHRALIEKVGRRRLDAIRADTQTGYAVNLDRR
jgi:glutaconate CoA-transferase, subunit A